MPKELILMEDVPGLGIEGDLVKVADGYARNFLLPKKLAASLSSFGKRQLAARQAAREERLRSEREKAAASASTLDGLSVTILMKAAEGGKLYGAVHAAEIVEALQKQDITVDHHALQIAEPLRELGVYDIPVKLHPEHTATLKVWVVEE